MTLSNEFIHVLSYISLRMVKSNTDHIFTQYTMIQGYPFMLTSHRHLLLSRFQCWIAISWFSFFVSLFFHFRAMNTQSQAVGWFSRPGGLWCLPLVVVISSPASRVGQAEQGGSGHGEVEQGRAQFHEIYVTLLLTLLLLIKRMRPYCWS